MPSPFCSSGHQTGHSLISLLLALSISALLLHAALSIYQSQNIFIKRQLAKQALIHNALFLEQHYAEHQTFKVAGNTWPTLPMPQSEGFSIRHSGHASSVDRADVYYLIAKALPHHTDPAFLRIDQSQQVLLCQPHGTSQRCQLY